MRLVDAARPTFARHETFHPATGGFERRMRLWRKPLAIVQQTCARPGSNVDGPQSVRRRRWESSCATSRVLEADQPNRALHSFCSEGRSWSLGGRCPLSATRTPNGPSKSRAEVATASASARLRMRSFGA